MKTKILSTVAMSVLSVLFAQAQVLGYRNGACLAQDGENLYVTSSEHDCFMVMDKATESVAIFDESSGEWPSQAGEKGSEHFLSVAARNGEAWMSYGYGQLMHFDGKKIDNVKQISSDGFLHNLILDSEGKLLATTLNERIYRFDGNLTPLSAFDFHEDYSLASVQPSQVLDRKGVLWTVLNADLRGTLYRYAEGTGEFVDMGDLRAMAVAEGSEGSIYVYAVNKNNSSVKRRTLSRVEGNTAVIVAEFPEDFPSGIVDMKIDSRNRVWLLARRAIYRYADGQIETFYHHAFTEHEPEHMKLSQILLDGETAYVCGGYFVGTLDFETNSALHHTMLFKVKGGEVSEISLGKGTRGTSPSGINTMKGQSDVNADIIFDLQGHRLAEAPAKGVFIQNGKKVIY